VSTEPG